MAQLKYYPFEYMLCYVIGAPPEDKGDLNTIMNIPAFFLHREGAGYDPPDRARTSDDV